MCTRTFLKGQGLAGNLGRIRTAGTRKVGTNHDDVFSFVRLCHFVVSTLRILAESRAG